MTNKRKRGITPREDVSKPSRWRLQHGAVTPPQRGADPSTGMPVLRRRTVDTLGMPLENGSITPEMHDAAAIFRAHFRAAALDGMLAMPLIRTLAARATP